MGNVKSADFNYILTEDSAPNLKEQLIDIYPETGEGKAEANIRFNYYLSSSDAMENEVVLFVSVDINVSGASHNYQTLAQGKYSTFPVTYPSAKFLNKLLSDGLDDIKKQVCSTL